MMKKKKRNAKEFFLRAESLVAIVIVVLFVTASIVRPETFPTVKNIFNICRTFAIYAIMGVGMAMIIITTGIDLSVGATAAFTVCLGAWVNKAVVESIFGEGAIAKVQGGPNGLPGPYNILLPLLMIVVVIVAGALIGLCNGLMVSKVKIPAFIATLGMANVTRGGALLITNGTPINHPYTWASVFGGGYIADVVPVSVIVMAVVVVVGYLFATRTLTGKNIYAVGNSPRAAKLSGINVDKTLTMVYVITSSLAGLVGLILIGQMNSADPSFCSGAELDVIAAAVVGGVSMSGGEGNIGGVVLGAALMGLLKNVFVHLAVPGYWQTVTLGVVIIGSVALDSLRKRADAK